MQKDIAEYRHFSRWICECGYSNHLGSDVCTNIKCRRFRNKPGKYKPSHGYKKDNDVGVCLKPCEDKKLNIFLYFL